VLRRILTGGQTGVDQAAWRAARAAGLVTGGTMPYGFQTEDGPRPEFARDFGAVAGESTDPAVRTLVNVAAADATMILVDGPPGPGTSLTIEACRRQDKPHRCVHLDNADTSDLLTWLAAHGVTTLNVAGDRESTRPGIGRRAEAFLRGLFEAVRGALQNGEPRARRNA
jgi:hypothetical protein